MFDGVDGIYVNCVAVDDSDSVDGIDVGDSVNGAVGKIDMTGFEMQRVFLCL